MSLPSPAGYSRATRVLPFGYAGLALLLAQLPPLFPLTFPDARVPTWYATAFFAAAVAVVVTWRPGTPRPLVLALGWAQLLATGANAFVFGDVLAMFCTWLSVPILALLAGRIGVRARKALLAVHVITAAAWLGVAVTFVLVSVVAMNTTDIVTAKVSYELLVVFDMTLLPYANFAASLAGIALGMTTKWGLLRYWWVAIKFVLPILILFGAFGYMHPMLESAAEQSAHLAKAGGTVSQIDGAAEAVFYSFGVSMLSLVAAMLLSLYKPGGRTPRGRRQLERGRQASAPSRTPAAEYAVTVADTRLIATGTAAITLRRADGAALPTWSPGSHVDLVLPSGKVRQYSLYGDPADTGTYHVAVLKEPTGRGGSLEIHALRRGDTLRVRGPRNNFPLVKAPSYVFIAGGVGIVPFLPMIAELDAADAEWRLVYRGGSMSTMAFAAELAERYGDRVRLLPAATHARPDLAALLTEIPATTAVYCCGPQSMLAAVEAATTAHHPHGTLHLERFTASARDHLPNTTFTAELARSGVTVEVPADQTLLSAIQRVDPTIDLSCEDGICGSCRTTVLAGTPEHRDDVLQPHERNRTDVLYPCVSRAVGTRIVLDV